MPEAKSVNRNKLSLLMTALSATLACSGDAYDLFGDASAGGARSSSVSTGSIGPGSGPTGTGGSFAGGAPESTSSTGAGGAAGATESDALGPIGGGAPDAGSI